MVSWVSHPSLSWTESNHGQKSFNISRSTILSVKWAIGLYSSSPFTSKMLKFYDPTLYIKRPNDSSLNLRVSKTKCLTWNYTGTTEDCIMCSQLFISFTIASLWTKCNSLHQWLWAQACDLLWPMGCVGRTTLVIQGEALRSTAWLSSLSWLCPLP